MFIEREDGLTSCPELHVCNLSLIIRESEVETSHVPEILTFEGSSKPKIFNLLELEGLCQIHGTEEVYVLRVDLAAGEECKQGSACKGAKSAVVSPMLGLQYVVIHK